MNLTSHIFTLSRTSYEDLPAITNAPNSHYCTIAFQLLTNDHIFMFTQALRSTLGTPLSAGALHHEGHTRLWSSLLSY